MKAREKSTIMRFGVPTVVLVKEDCSLVGYDTLCACSADMLQELSASIFNVCIWHILDCHPEYHRRHCSMYPAAGMDISFGLSSEHRHRPGATIWILTFASPGENLQYTPVTKRSIILPPTALWVAFTGHWRQPLCATQTTLAQTHYP